MEPATTAPPSPPDAGERTAVWRQKYVRLAVIAVMLASGGWSVYKAVRPIGEVTLTPHPLPGFDLALPEGTEKGTTSDYGLGHLHIQSVGGVAAGVQVKWEAGTLFDAPLLTTIGQGIAVALGKPGALASREAAVPVPGDPPSGSAVLTIDDLTIWLTQIACGGRRILIMTSSNRPSVAPLHRRIINSYRCHPDPIQDKALGEVPVVFDVAESWKRLPSEPNQLQLTNGEQLLMAQIVNGTEVDKGVEAMLEVPGFLPGVTVKARAGDHWPIEMKEDDGSVEPGSIVLLPCPERKLTLMLFALANPGSDPARGLALLRGARCRGRGEPFEARP